ncbi:MAG: hypothetical protein FJW23_11295 [Acidimicrobiia bacterium]|nr:hypothetical protein [Acidimicrobiia bacterium]
MSAAANPPGPLTAQRTLGIAAAYLLVTVAMTWPYVSWRDFASASYGGDMRLIIWTLAWDNHALLSGTPLFDANVFFPAERALRYNEHLFGVSLFALPWTLAGASPVLAHNATWWLGCFLNGPAAFLLLRRFVRDPLAAFAGSLAFAWSFYVMLHAHGHLHLVWMWPIPLSLVLLERWFDEPRLRRLVPWAVVALLGLLTSWYMAVLTAIANALAGLVFAWSLRRSRDAWPRRVVHLMGAALVLAVALYPFARHYVGLQADPAEAAAHSATLTDYLVPPENTLAGRWWEANVDERPGSIYGETTVFSGWIALLLATLGLASFPDRRHLRSRAWMFPLLVLAGFFLSLGPEPALPGGPALAPFRWLASLPGFSGMRAPARFALLASLGLAGLAAMGAGLVVRCAGRAGRAAVLLLVPLMLAEWFVIGFPAGPPRPEPIPPIYRTPQVQSARSVISLPEYRGTEAWFLGGDYLYYSTAHWRPIVNGFGRAEPPGHDEAVRLANAFPASTDQLRELGVQYVVVHAARFPDRGEKLLLTAQVTPRCRLVTYIGTDYLFELIEQ